MDAKFKEKLDHRKIIFQTGIYSYIGGFGLDQLHFLIREDLTPVCTLFKAVGIFGILYYGWTQSKYNLIFKNCGLGIGTAYPLYKTDYKTNVSTITKFTLPKGMCEQDFLNHKDAIQQAIGKDIDIKYTFKEIMIEEFNPDRKILYDYEPIKISGNVPLLLGYEPHGELITADLSAGEPHVLLAGSTGCGKSTAFRAIITNFILMSNVLLYLIDLKRGNEFRVFGKSSRVMRFGRTTLEARSILEELDGEIETRSELFFQKNVKDITDYNIKFPRNKLPFKVLIIDEFADLAHERGKGKYIDLEYVENLGRKARSIGIHILIATQRPDSNIVSGAIKGNFNNVIGMLTTDGTNSRIIINQTGLELLRGDGHAKFKRGNTMREIQIPYLSIDKCQELIQHTYIDKPKEKIIENGELTEEGAYDLEANW